MGYLLCEMLYWCRKKFRNVCAIRWMIRFLSVYLSVSFFPFHWKYLLDRVGDENPGQILARIHLAASQIVNSPGRSLETRQIRTVLCESALRRIFSFCPRDAVGRHELWFPIVKSRRTNGGTAVVVRGSSKLLASIGLATIQDNPAADTI